MKSLGSNFRNHVIIHFILTTIHCYQDEYYITDQSVSPSPPPLFILSPSSSPSSDYFTPSSIPPSYASPSEFPTYSEFFFTLQGTYNSFAQFKSWDISRNGSLSFHFRTTEPNSLVLYSQSEKCCDFIELKLVEGSLRLRFNLTQGTSILSLGRNLHDYQWHHIAIIVNKEGILLKIDGEIGSRNLRSPEYLTEKQMKMDYLFIGGLPHNYSSEFVSIYLPWVFFEPTFRGQIKGLIYTSEEFIALADNLEPIRWHGLRHNTHEPCLEYDPCNHGGTCINTDNGAECDCRSLDYIGNYCDKPKYSPEATFSGQEFIFFNNISKSILSSSDEISLYFKSRQSNGLLFYSGDGHGDYLNLAIRDGGVMLSVKLGSGLTERTVKPARIRFDDNQWHKVLVHRKVREITRATSFCHFSLTIDGVYTERGSIAGTFSLLSSSILYIGGSDHFEHLPGSRVPSNFIGCLRKVEFIGDSMVLDILDLAKSDLHLFQVKGNLVDSCQEVEAADPVTFTTKESFLALPRWEAVKGGSLSLKVRTNEPNGVLMFSAGGSHSGPNTVLGTSIGASHVGLSLPIRPSDFFALELLDGQIYLLLNLGSGSIKVKASSRRIDDSHWHVITLLRTAKSGRVTVDDAAVDFVTPGGSNQLDLDGPLYLGSVGPTAVGRSSFSMGNGIPPELWAGSLKYGYVGCVRDLVLNNQAIDIASIARKQDSGSVKPSCHSIPSHCDNKPCFNDGICNEGWNRFVCDCRATSFTGPVCTKDATTLNFDGDDFMLIDLGETIVTQAEDLNIRFKTTQLSGFLLTASSFTDKSGSHLTVTLENSRIKVTVNLGEGNKVSYIGNDLGDDKWHTLRLQRRGPSLEVKLDSEYSITELTGQLVDLTYSYITLGSPTTDLIRPVGQWTSSSLLVGKEVPNFIGSIQNFVLNDAAYIEMSKQGVDLNFTVTATYGKKGGAVHSPFTFKSRRTYIGLPQLKAYSTMALYFQFKTTLSNGLILFNGGKEADFIAIELVNGHIHYTFNMGDGPRRIKSSTRSPLNDGKWHSVAVGRPSLGQHTLMVDELVSSISNTGPNLHLDLDGLLYLGGLPREMYATLPPLVQSTHGFEGCLASLDLNGETIDPNGSDALIPSTLVARGCASDSTTGLGSGSEVDCAKSNCENKQGNCLSSDTDCLCDDPGSDKCPQSLGSASYQWGPKGGLIMFTFPDKKLDTKIDQLSISFSTESDNAVLFRVDSGSSADYMELQIFDGTVLMVYNLGTKDHDIGQLDVKVNDGRVHVVRFTRTGPNSTLQVDNHNAVRKNPSGSRQLTVFNSHYKVQVGGKLGPGKETGSLEKPFVGIISGLIYNGLRILDLAMDADPRIGVKGDVTLVTSSGSLGRLKPEKSKSKDQLKPEVKGEDTSSTVKEDSLIFSGEGSGGCYDNDDDDCEFTTAKETELDELITPKFVLSSLRPPTWNNELPTPITSSSSLSTPSTSPAPIPLWPPATTSDRPNKPCNTEDCFDFENSIDNDLGQSPPWGSNSGHQLEVTSSYPPFWNEYDRSTYTYTSPPQVTYPKIAVLPPSQYPHRSRLPLPTRPTGTPRINDVPIPRRPDRPLETGNEKPARDKPKLNIGSVSTDNTTLLIGLTALGLIVIVVATPLIFYSYIRYQNDRYYKGHIPVNGNSRSNGTDVKINFTPVTGAPPLLASDADLESRYRAPTESHIIGETGKRAKKKDMREWYV